MLFNKWKCMRTRLSKTNFWSLIRMTLSQDLSAQKMAERLWCIRGKLFSLDKWTKIRVWTSSPKTLRIWKMPRMLYKHQLTPQETRAYHISIRWIGWLRLRIFNLEDLSSLGIIKADWRALIRGLIQKWSMLITTLSDLSREFLVLFLKRNNLKSQKKQRLRKKNRRQKRRQS